MLPGDDVLASPPSNAGMNILKYLRSIACGALRGIAVQQLFQFGVSKSGLSANEIDRMRMTASAGWTSFRQINLSYIADKQFHWRDG
jgi:hypothetical protein